MQDVSKSTSVIISLVIGVGISVLILVLLSSLTGKTYDIVEDDIALIGENKITAEAFTALNDTQVSLDHSMLWSNSLVVWNDSVKPSTVGIGNFTVDYDAGTVILKTNTWNNTEVYANYTWGAKDVQSRIRGAVYGGFNAQENMGDYLPIIVLAIIMAIILTLVLGYVGVTGSKGGSTAL